MHVYTPPGYEKSNASVVLFKKHSVDVVSHESEGGHTWSNWRDYLIEFAPERSR
ncbi:MAG: hypothetical protein V4671_28945 [Armatimonadota bacterium]